MSDTALLNGLIRVAHENPELRGVLLPMVVARTFRTEDALKSYLKKHPKADPARHSVGGGKEKGKGPSAKGKAESKKLEDSARAKDRSMVKNLSPAQRKKVLQTALSMENAEHAGQQIPKKDRAKLKDISKSEGFGALKGLSPAAQRAVLEKALKMASTYPTPKEVAVAAEAAAKAVFKLRGSALPKYLDLLNKALEDVSGSGVSFKGEAVDKFKIRMRDLKLQGLKADDAIMTLADSAEALARDLKKLKS